MRDGRRDESRTPSATADKAGTRGRHGARQGQWEHDGGRREKVGAEPLGVGGNNGGRKASRVDPEPHGVGGEEGGREASGVAENPGEERHGVGGGVDSPQGNLTPRGAERPRGDETLGALTASQYRQGEDGQGRGGGDKNPPTARATRRQVTDGGDRAARSRRTAVTSAEMETAAGDGDEAPPPEHFDGADGARTENGMQPRRKYDNVALEVSERGQASAGAAAGEDGHGATETSAGRRRAEEREENPQHVPSEGA